MSSQHLKKHPYLNTQELPGTYQAKTFDPLVAEQEQEQEHAVLLLCFNANQTMACRSGWHLYEGAAGTIDKRKRANAVKTTDVELLE